MSFYIAKGLQLAGLLGMPLALYIGISQDDGIGRELGYAALGASIFYLGYLMERR